MSLFMGFLSVFTIMTLLVSTLILRTSRKRVRKVNLSYSLNRIWDGGLQVKVARRYQVTIPEDVRAKAKISVGDDVDVRYEDGKILLEKLEDNWEKVMKETEGSWAQHPVFGKMKNSVEIVHWLRSQR